MYALLRNSIPARIALQRLPSRARFSSMASSGFYALSAQTASGATLDFSSLQGKVVVVVNVASKSSRVRHMSSVLDQWQLSSST
ncbi:hypothetical protein TSOC_005440 [Tetrabaena socialis]|uniref:Glutathione peroxidase n=1 Tax=Tetrabaena socialis TaxID=47790 RepID=A0A2J8A6A0_9CHLO|nr:hypothetical protein TSOC_005440 [Tetrabaena socialis]|eukprot:PNH08054.1 hypothetical protein TSOC_005440 [Tetrabaena socialis]